WRLVQSALLKVTAENWRRACEHAEKIEESYWQADRLMDEISDRFEINLDDTNDENENEDIETCQEESLEEGNATTDLCLL
ncbi:hypothetical protein L9F63_001372, partial [Diploptera punctata]